MRLWGLGALYRTAEDNPPPSLGWDTKGHLGKPKDRNGDLLSRRRAAAWCV